MGISTEAACASSVVSFIVLNMTTRELWGLIKVSNEGGLARNVRELPATKGGRLAPKKEFPDIWESCGPTGFYESDRWFIKILDVTHDAISILINSQEFKDVPELYRWKIGTQLRLQAIDGKVYFLDFVEVKLLPDQIC